MPVLLKLICLTQNIFKLYLFAFKIHNVLVYNSLVIFHCVDISHFSIHSSGMGQLGCLQFLAIMNKVALNLFEQVDFRDGEASFRNGIAGFLVELFAHF